MKILLKNIKKEFTPDNMTAAISCLIISITIYFILAVINREILL
ncbi:hypothetical protein HME9304_00735 [Flagellimonas maritima]|uniref:Uncharacterized protein n=1 Tax=Flagellimonas maritima TaxID=1383885 RepID=A0A2Z4LQ96_9FLAO|nr:hypothetical protein [Allomuricauda aurantiaca]AWX43744.1 hypothetical protein HME9304_00735 [Allomuricauda aurantiaca]